MTSYETTLIFDPQLQEEGWEKAVEEYAAIIGRGGEIKLTDRWGLRRLAYPIRRKNQGYYVHFHHDSPPEIPREIERRCKLDENCLRYLTVVADNPKYVEEMEKRDAARASTTTTATPPPAVDDAKAPAKSAQTTDAPAADAPVIEAPAAEAVASDAPVANESAGDAPAGDAAETPPAEDTPEPSAKETEQ